MDKTTAALLVVLVVAAWVWCDRGEKRAKRRFEEEVRKAARPRPVDALSLAQAWVGERIDGNPEGDVAYVMVEVRYDRSSGEQDLTSRVERKPVAQVYQLRRVEAEA